MSLEFIGFTLDTVGKIMVAFTAIMVHHRFSEEQKLDSKVLNEMKREKVIGIVGVTFIVIGYLLQLSSKF